MLYLVERVHGDVGFFHLQSSATGTGITCARNAGVRGAERAQ